MKRLWTGQLGEVDLAPHAVLRTSVEQLQDDLGIKFETSQDDLDSHESAFFKLDGMVVAIIHNRGEPKDNVNVYLRRDLKPRDAAKAVGKIMKHFSLSPDLVVWQWNGAL
jgi:hypothetical protein